MKRTVCILTSLLFCSSISDEEGTVTHLIEDNQSGQGDWGQILFLAAVLSTEDTLPRGAEV